MLLLLSLFLLHEEVKILKSVWSVQSKSEFKDPLPAEEIIDGLSGPRNGYCFAGLR